MVVCKCMLHKLLMFSCMVIVTCLSAVLYRDGYYLFGLVSHARLSTNHNSVHDVTGYVRLAQDGW